METFKKALLAGDAHPDQVAVWVEAWHEGAGQSMALHAYLGMTWGEYAIWARKPEEFFTQLLATSA